MVVDPWCGDSAINVVCHGAGAGACDRCCCLLRKDVLYIACCSIIE